MPIRPFPIHAADEEDPFGTYGYVEPGDRCHGGRRTLLLEAL
jgi:hypothetical protein